MIFFSIEDYFYNITPVKRWGFLILLMCFGLFWQITRLVNNYHEQNLLERKIRDQQEIIFKLKNVLSQKKVSQQYCDFYKLDYDELKLLLSKIIDSNNHIKNIIIEPENSEKILLHLDLEN